MDGLQYVSCIFNLLSMETNFKKSNFAIWCKIAVYASKNEFILIPKYNDRFMDKHRKYLASMSTDGYLIREVWWANKNAIKYTPTEKFKYEFKEKYCEISKKIRPDFTDEIRNKMLAAFNF